MHAIGIWWPQRGAILYVTKLYIVLICLGCGQNPARQASMEAGIPKEVTSTNINMLCGSGLKAVALGYQAIRCQDATLVVTGGQESMSQVRVYCIARKDCVNLIFVLCG